MLTLTACTKAQNVKPEITLNAQALATEKIECGVPNSSVKKVSGQAGKVYYNTYEKAYTIVVTIPGTFDSQDIGVLCNIPQELKTDGLSVKFDGEYRKYDKQPSVVIGGQKFYYLLLSKVTYTPQ